MNKLLSLSLCLLLSLAAWSARADKLAILGLVSGDAAHYNTEFQQYGRMIPVYKQAGLQPVLVEMAPFLGGAASADEIYQSLQPLHALILTTTSESGETVRLTPAQAAYGKMVGEALVRFVSAGGGLFVQACSVRYPNTDDEKYWNIVLAPLGIEILHEGCYDPTRSFVGTDLGVATYWFTQNIQPHPVTQDVHRLVLPLHGPGPWPGVPALRYSADWQVLVSGEKEAKSFSSDDTNSLRLENPGSYASAPPVVAVRTLGAGRVVSFPLAPIHSGMNYLNPLWKNTVETAGDRAAALPSDTLKLLLQAYRWIAEPALANPALGAYQPVPYAPVKFPASVDWDQFSFTPPAGAAFTYPDGQKMDFLPPSDGVRGVMGAVSSYAGGQGTVAEYVAAARAAGLAFIVFADPLEKLTPATLDSLEKDCAAASAAGDFYACPGILFTDGIGNRWFFWGEKIVFPAATGATYGGKGPYPQWDGQRVHQYGDYIAACAYPPSALLDYKQLAANGAHRENMWWFYDYLPLVYDGGKLVADNYQQFLFGLRDLRWSALASYTGMTSPADVAAAARTCVTSFRDLPSVKICCNTRCGAYGQAATGRQFVTQGPTIAAWDAMDQQMEQNWKFTRGAQRVRLHFVVRSPQGIAEVAVHDADTAVVRRFLGHGEKELTRDFEIVDDQQHYLTLEVTDTAGHRAFSWYILVFSYKQGLFRCGDNLNILGATGLLWHPDRNQILNCAKAWENGMDFTLTGWDSGGYLCPMPGAELLETIRTTEGEYPQFRRDGLTGKILDMTLSSYNVQIATQRMTMISEPFDSATRPSPALGTICKDLGPLKYYTRTHTIYAPMTRTDWYTAWNYRRPHEGAKDYRGGLIWHEGEFTFTRDVTLQGKVPLPLVRLTCPTDPDKGWGGTAIIKQGDGSTRVALVRDPQKLVTLSGTIHPGGYATQMPSLVGYLGFLCPPGMEYSYSASLTANPLNAGSIEIGLGHDGQQIKAGTVLRYRFAVGTFAVPLTGNDAVEDTVAALNLSGAQTGYPVTMTAGRLVDSTFFFTTEAVAHEAAFTLGKRDLIIDLPLRVTGLQDNGCAAVYTTRRPWFRFVPVVAGTAYFQESTQADNDLWVGNPFVCDNPSARLTLVVDGQAVGKNPRLDVHNPTDKPLTATLTSPPHTPLFGGLTGKVTIPAGDSVWLEIANKSLVPVR